MINMRKRAEAYRGDWATRDADAKHDRNAITAAPDGGSNPGPLWNGYYVRNPLLYLFLRISDAFARMLAAIRPDRDGRGAITPSPARILIINPAHLGDVILATAILAPIKARFPAARIGFLTGSWSRPALEGHPMVDWLHSVDHWKLSRAAASPIHKFLHYRRTRSRALKEIRATGYDVAIDLYFFYPNLIPIAWRANIPVRIGYTSGGYAPLLTHAVEWRDSGAHVVDHCRALLEPLGITREFAASYGPSLPESRIGDGSDHVVAPDGIGTDGYVVIHPGTGADHKNWPIEKWRALARGLAGEGIRIVFTGTGAAETALTDSIAIETRDSVNLCGRLDWPSFVEVVRSARLVIGVDSAGVHAASAVGTRSISIVAGLSPHLFRPYGKKARVLMAPVACSPCYRGCAAMACVRDVTPESVRAAALEQLDAARAVNG